VSTATLFASYTVMRTAEVVLPVAATSKYTNCVCFTSNDEAAWLAAPWKVPAANVGRVMRASRKSTAMV
jgi:hypothetical protein